MPSNSALESTIDQVLERNSAEFSQSLKNSLGDAQKTLSDSLPMLEEEYEKIISDGKKEADKICLLYTSPSPRDRSVSRMPSSA